MPKIPQHIIDSVPGLKSAQNRDDVTFINFDSDETSPTITEGFSDEDILKMDMKALEDSLNAINVEEQNLVEMQLSVVKRRNSVLALISRKKEIT